MSFQRLGVFLFSHAASALAAQLRENLPASLDESCEISLLAPKQLLARHGELTDISAYESLSSALGHFWEPGGAVIFIGAAGIAVRAIAPLLQHKSSDAPVLVLDAAGRYCVNLLSGHWGGGNALTRKVAQTIGATPVVTTASEVLGGRLALDVMVKDAEGKILDWDELARAQGHILEGRPIPIWDPMHIMPGHDLLVSAREKELHPDEHAPALAVHWRRLRKTPGLTRIAMPVLHVGAGFRKSTSFLSLLNGLNQALDGLEPAAVKVLATVDVKAQDEALARLADRYGLAIEAYSAADLARVATPNPSVHAGKRFGVEPFSVCEAAALLSAGQCGRPCLLRPKIRINRAMTFSVAIAIRGAHA